MSGETDQDLESQGLIGESYDSVMNIRTRIRQLNDIPIPFRGGITPAQFAILLFGPFVMLMFYAILVAPLARLFGIHLHFLIILAIIFGIPGIASWRALKPMRYGKTIPSTLSSLWRSLTDTRVHARGLPIAERPEDAVDGATLVYQRVWTPAEAVTEPELTDERAERLLAGFYPDTEQWARAKAEAHIEKWHEHQSVARSQRERASTTRSRGGDVAMDDKKESA